MLPLAGQEFFPLDQVQAGQRAVGRTVFSGATIEQFDVEILGVLENFSGPKSSVIFGRLSGGPLADTGVMSGMSGSPVYIDGKLAGAVAFMFPFSKEPLAGIRPIAKMVEGMPEGAVGNARPAVDPLEDWRLALGMPPSRPPEPRVASQQFLPIATPVSLGGLTRRTLDVFGSKLEDLGLRPVQGSGGSSREAAADQLEPGSMISVGLMRGDINFTASGTVTHVDGERVYAFGHRFLSMGDTRMPMMRASVMTLVPNLSASFKLSGTGPLIGSVVLDRDAGITGILGSPPSMIPVTIRVRTAAGVMDYAAEVIRDDQLTPFLLQMAVFSSIDVTQRAFGPMTVRVRGGVDFGAGLPRLVLDDIYTGQSGVGAIAALSTMAPLTYFLQTSHPNVEIASVDIELDVTPADQYTDLVQAWTSKTQARPGETVMLHFAVKEADGTESVRSIPLDVPVSTPAGAVEVTLGDALTANSERWRGLLGGRKVRDPAATIRFLNSLRGSDGAYLRLWRRTHTLWLHADKLPAPPASLHAVLSTPAGRGAGAQRDRTSTVHQQRLDGFDGVVRGRLDLRFVVTGS